MAKVKFERTKPHVNIGTIGHVDHGRQLLQQLSQEHSLSLTVLSSLIIARSITAPRKELVVSQSTLVTLNTRQLTDTTLTLTAPDTQTTLRT